MGATEDLDLLRESPVPVEVTFDAGVREQYAHVYRLFDKGRGQTTYVGSGVLEGDVFRLTRVWPEDHGEMWTLLMDRIAEGELQCRVAFSEEFARVDTVNMEYRGTLDLPYDD